MNKVKRKKRSFAITVMLIIMTLALCITLISCGDDEKTDYQQGEIKTEKNVKESQQEKKSETGKTTQKATQATTQKLTTEAATQAATQAKKVCYISVEGYCSNKEISLQGGDTAYSILTRSGATVSGSGSYIKGINGKFEFDEGPTSGWIYYVNGSRPAMGCGSCSIKAGDSISWDYVSKF